MTYLKKLSWALIAAGAAVVLLAATGRSSIVDLEPVQQNAVSQDNTVLKYVYQSDVSLVQNASATYRLSVPGVSGNIRAASMDFASTDLDVWLSEQPADNVASAYNVLARQAANLIWAPALTAPQYYRNRDTPARAALYLTLDNQCVTPTGAWNLILTFGR